MLTWITTLTILAQETTEKAPAKPQPQGNPLVSMLPFIIGMVLLYYVLIHRPSQRDRETRESFHDSLKKTDKVVTIGGIVGSVHSISQDGKFVTLKMDDGSKIKMLKKAIQSRLGDEQDVDSKSIEAADENADGGSDD